MATAEVSIIALGRTTVSASEYIAEMQRRLQKQDKVRSVEEQMHRAGTAFRRDRSIF